MPITPPISSGGGSASGIFAGAAKILEVKMGTKPTVAGTTASDGMFPSKLSADQAGGGLTGWTIAWMRHPLTASVNVGSCFNAVTQTFTAPETATYFFDVRSSGMQGAYHSGDAFRPWQSFGITINGVYYAFAKGTTTHNENSDPGPAQIPGADDYNMSKTVPIAGIYGVELTQGDTVQFIRTIGASESSNLSNITSHMTGAATTEIHRLTHSFPLGDERTIVVYMLGE